jgi:hypothetical protein
VVVAVAVVAERLMAFLRPTLGGASELLVAGTVILAWIGWRTLRGKDWGGPSEHD